MVPIFRRSVLVLLTALLVAGSSSSQEFTSDFDRDGCTFSTTGNNPYRPLLPGHQAVIEGQEDDNGELIDILVRTTVLDETKIIDGVLTRVVEEYEEEDGDLVEIARTFLAQCRETGDVWYFGEDFEEYEDGDVADSGTEWRAGEDGASPGILMPGSVILGARYHNNFGPEVQERAEVVATGDTMAVTAGSFDGVLTIQESDALDPGSVDDKFYAPGIGVIQDEVLQLTGFTLPRCVPDETTHCLNDGRFQVKVDWTLEDGTEGDGQAILPSADSGEFWFFDSGNTEVLVKVLDACGVVGFDSFWVFAAGLTDLELTVEVLDLETGTLKEYDNDASTPFQPVLDTAAFKTCP